MLRKFKVAVVLIISLETVAKCIIDLRKHKS